MFDREKARRLAAAALVAQMRDAPKTAVETVQQLSDECGAEALTMALCAWIDTLAHRTGLPFGKPIRLAFAGIEDGEAVGEMTDADAVSRPEVVWAGRLATARIAGDTDTFNALLDALPGDDPGAVGRHVYAVLESCALTMTHFGVTR